MTYAYEDHRAWTLTDEGQRDVLRVRDAARRLCEEAGAVTCGALIRASKAGDSWLMLAVVDRLVELGSLRRVQTVARRATQDEIFVWSDSR